MECIAPIHLSTRARASLEHSSSHQSAHTPGLTLLLISPHRLKQSESWGLQHHPQLAWCPDGHLHARCGALLTWLTKARKVTGVLMRIYESCVLLLDELARLADLGRAMMVPFAL